MPSLDLLAGLGERRVSGRAPQTSTISGAPSAAASSMARQVVVDRLLAFGFARSTGKNPPRHSETTSRPGSRTQSRRPSPDPALPEPLPPDGDPLDAGGGVVLRRLLERSHGLVVIVWTQRRDEVRSAVTFSGKVAAWRIRDMQRKEGVV